MQDIAAGCEVVSCEITDSRFYLKAVTPRITGEVKVGEVVQAGVSISDSEIGVGKAKINPLIYKLACKNWLIVSDMSMERIHIGLRINDDDLEVNGFYSQETIKADIGAFLLKARYAIRGILDQKVFTSVLNEAKVAAGMPIQNPEAEIIDVTKRYQLTEEEHAGILRNFIDGGDVTRWGLVNAITKTAHSDVTNYDRSTELEEIGGNVLFSNVRQAA
jgi:hypothetical protein